MRRAKDEGPGERDCNRDETEKLDGREEFAAGWKVALSPRSIQAPLRGFFSALAAAIGHLPYRLR
jgi:hypothetical protein